MTCEVASDLGRQQCGKDPPGTTDRALIGGAKALDWGGLGGPWLGKCGFGFVVNWFIRQCLMSQFDTTDQNFLLPDSNWCERLPLPLSGGRRGTGQRDSRQQTLGIGLCRGFTRNW